MQLTAPLMKASAQLLPQIKDANKTLFMMRHDHDEFMEIEEAPEIPNEEREKLVADITKLYEANLENPSLLGMQLEKSLREYLELADNLLDFPDDTEAAMRLAKLGMIISELWGAYIQEQEYNKLENSSSATPIDLPLPGTPEQFVIPGNTTIH